MATENPAPQAAPQPQKRGPLVIILVVVGVLVVAGIAVGIWKVTSDDSSDSGGPPAGQTAKGLYKAWQDGDQAAAAKDATPVAVTAIFKVQPTDASGLEFGGCSATGDDPFPKECVWSRPGGELTMTVEKQGDKPVVTSVKYGPAGLPPDTDATG